MARRDRMEHHAGRALAELERARGAASEEAAMAHLELSELHLAEMHAIGQSPPAPTFRLVGSEPAEPDEEERAVPAD